MDLAHPFRFLTPNLEGEILMFLSRGDAAHTGRAIQRAIGSNAQDQVRVTLQRLAKQGIVTAEPGGGRAILYRLNREHLAAPYIEGIAMLRLELLDRLRDEVGHWAIQPSAAALFGSVARSEATSESDLDLLVIRPTKVDPDDDAWQNQLSAISESATRWTGNDARILEYGEDEVMEIAGHEPVLEAAVEDGIDIGPKPLRRLWKKALQS